MASTSIPVAQSGHPHKEGAAPMPQTCKKGEPCCPGKKHGGRLLRQIHNESGHHWLESAEKHDVQVEYELGTALLATFFEQSTAKGSQFEAFFKDFLKESINDYPAKPSSYTPRRHEKGATLPCPSKVAGQAWLVSEKGVDITYVSQLVGANFVANSVNALLASKEFGASAKAALTELYRSAHWFTAQTSYTSIDMLTSLARIVRNGVRAKPTATDTVRDVEDIGKSFAPMAAMRIRPSAEEPRSPELSEQEELVKSTKEAKPSCCRK